VDVADPALLTAVPLVTAAPLLTVPPDEIVPPLDTGSLDDEPALVADVPLIAFS